MESTLIANEASLGHGEAFAYGLIQGVSEFLPISSSGHLKLAHRFGLGGLPPELEMPFDVLLHGATLIAICLAFRKEILAACKPNLRLWTILSLAIVPAGLAGFFGKSVVEGVGESLLLIGVCYVFTAALLLIAEQLNKKRHAQVKPETEVNLESITPAQGVLVGFLQIFALFPGVSRSGSTIAAGLIGGMSSKQAVAFSFLIGLPLIAAATAKDALGGEFTKLIDAVGWGPLITGFVTSLISGIASIAALKIVAEKKKLSWFAAYCVIIALACFAFHSGSSDNTSVQMQTVPSEIEP